MRAVAPVHGASAPRCFVVALLAVLSLLSCASRAAFKHGEEAFQNNEVDQAVQYYMRALQSEPENARYRFALGRSLISASNYHLRRGQDMLAAGDTRLALYEFDKAIEFNPTNNEAQRQKVALLRRLAEEKKRVSEQSDLEQLKAKVAQSESQRAPTLHPEKEPFNLKLGEADLTTILRALQSLSGIRILFDKGFQSQKLSVDLEQVTFKEAVDKILIQTKSFYKVIDDRTIIVVPDSPQKRAEYNELAMRTFFLSNADLKQVDKEIHDLVGIKATGLDETLNAITLRDTPEKIAVAEKLIHTLDKPRAELLIDIEIFEVNRRRMKSYGIELSQYYVSEFLYPWSTTDTTKIQPGAAIPGNVFKHLNLADFFFNLPSVAYKLMQEDSQTKVKAKPQVRVVDGEEVLVHLGDRVPILQTSFVPNYGSVDSSTLRQNPINSYVMTDIGLKIKMKPRVHHDGWISLNLDFELTFITSAGTETKPPTIGTRNVKSVIRLQDNETGILAGLLRDNERKSVTGLPGITSLPILKEIFSSNQRDIEQTDVILTLTPRIIKFPDIDEEDLRSYLVGTEENIGLKEQLPASPFEKMKRAAKPEGSVQRPVPGEPKATTVPPLTIEVPEAGGAQTAPAVVPEESKPPELPPQAITESQTPQEEPSGGLLLLTPDQSTVRVGEAGAMELIIENVKELQMVEGEIRFAADKIQIDRVDAADFVRTHGGDVRSSIDNKAGTIKLSIVLGGMASGVRSEKLAIVHFKGLSPGEAIVSMPEMRVSDPRLQELPFSSKGAVLTVTDTDGGGR